MQKYGKIIENMNLKACLRDVWRPTEIFGCGSISVSLLNTENENLKYKWLICASLPIQNPCIVSFGVH